MLAECQPRSPNDRARLRHSPNADIARRQATAFGADQKHASLAQRFKILLRGGMSVHGVFHGGNHQYR